MQTPRIPESSGKRSIWAGDQVGGTQFCKVEFYLSLIKRGINEWEREFQAKDTMCATVCWHKVHLKTNEYTMVKEAVHAQEN